MQPPQNQRYVQPKIFTPPPPSINQPLTAAPKKSLTFEFESSDPIISLSGEVIPTAGEERYDFILPNAPLTEDERKYCRCLLRVEDRGGVRNPYAVCTSRVGSQVQMCSQYYDWPAMSLEVLLAYAHLHKVNVTGVTTRNQALQAIGRWKQSRGETFYQ